MAADLFPAFDSNPAIFCINADGNSSGVFPQGFLNKLSELLFIEAIRTGDAGLLRNDYHDGLYSLGPVLAGWESARRGGATLHFEEYLREQSRAS